MFCFSGRDSQKEERLMDAASEGDLATVRELIKTTDVDSDHYGSTLLIEAGKAFLSI